MAKQHLNLRRCDREPEEHLRHAYRRGLLDLEQLWLDMLKDRNLSSHFYNAEMAQEIFGRLPSHYHALRGCSSG